MVRKIIPSNDIQKKLKNIEKNIIKSELKKEMVWFDTIKLLDDILNNFSKLKFQTSIELSNKIYYFYKKGKGTRYRYEVILCEDTKDILYMKENIENAKYKSISKKTFFENLNNLMMKSDI